MPTVPGLVPTAEPTTQGVSDVSVNVNADAFGAGVGHAIANLGPVVEQAGDRIWARAVELQNLQNETDAKNADSKFMLESAKMRADFTNLQGVNAGPAALKQHLDDLTKLRTGLRDSLSNPMAQKMYDSSSLSFMGREAFSAAAHSGGQMKVAANNADSARIATIDADIANNPGDEVQFQRGTQAKAAAIEDIGRRAGDTPETIADSVRDGMSSSITARAVSLARQGKIEDAESMVEKARKSGELTQKDGDRADNVVRTMRNAIGSANIAQSEYNNGVVEGKQTKSMKEVVDGALATAEQKYPGDTVFAEHTRREAQSLYRVGISEEQNEKYRNVQTVTGLQNAGADTLQKLLADPEGAKAYMNLPETAKKSIQKEFDRTTNVRNFAVAMGRSYDSDPDVRAKFMESTRGDYDSMDDTQWNRILQRRESMLKAKDKEADPRVPRALDWLRNSQFAGTMSAMNIYRRSTKDEFDQNNYHQFVGTLHDAIEDWQSINGKPPSQEDVVTKIGPMILQQQNVHHWYKGDTQEPAFVTPPENFIKSFAMSRQNHGGAVPTKEETQREYVRFQLNELYKAKKKPTDGQ